MTGFPGHFRCNVYDMRMSLQILIIMMVLVLVIWTSVVHSATQGSETDVYDEDDEDDPKVLFAKSKNEAIKLEIVVILADSSNTSLGLSKSLSRALKSIPISLPDTSPNQALKRLVWRVRNFVVSSQNGSAQIGESDSQKAKITSTVKSTNNNTGTESENFDDREPQTNALFHPNLIPQLCNFLGRTKAISLVNLIEDAGSERLLSLISNTASIPLIGSFQSGEPLQSQQKNEEDLHVSLTTSVQYYARALGYLLASCHWHTFTVIFDDVPLTLSSQLIWKAELSSMKITSSYPAPSLISANKNNPLDSNVIAEDEYESYEEFDYETYTNGNRNASDAESAPSLNPIFVPLRSKTLEYTVLRVLHEISKSTQGVVVLLCSEKSLAQVFLAAHKLRMLNGDYIFVLVDQYSQFEETPEWIPNGVLALRSPLKAQVGKQSLKRVGRLLESALHSSLSTLSSDEETEEENLGKDSSANVSTMRTSNADEEENPFHYNTEAQFPQLSFEGERRYKRFTSRSKSRHDLLLVPDFINSLPNVSCWKSSYIRKIFSETLARGIRAQMEMPELPNATKGTMDEVADEKFDILNLIGAGPNRHWKTVGNVSVQTSQVLLDTIRWPGGGILSARAKELKSFRIVTIVAPPFVMAIESFDNKSCEKGLPCLKVQTNNQDELAWIFADFENGKSTRTGYKVLCCDGFAMDLLSSISRELNFRINLFLVPDGFFGSLSPSGDWNGLMSAILSGSAHMSFAPFSVTAVRSKAIDFSTPFFFSGVSFLGIARTQDVPLLAFLAPFSFELWAAIFITLNITALAVALFEWLSPFGLNPWGRQRTKNFSISSALWVVWGRLFSHLVAFKAPKSWPNKFLINVWGGFSVIFVASYTANIAALFAGMFFERGIDVHDRSLLSQRVAAVKHSATPYYIKNENQLLWEHIQKFPVFTFQQGIDLLRNGTLDLLAGDGALLDYYRGSDPYCNLIDVSDHDKIGDDTYAIGMTKGFPLRESISAIIAKYIGNGFLDHLQGKWYGQLACFRKRRAEITGARALGVDSVAGMIIMLGLGMLIGLLILFMELLVYKFALPYLRRQPKGTLWRSPNIMFFSQKLYRFINCVELVSPHHAAKELVDTLRQGQITSLFQKSVKRKEHEQRRRRKSKAQFFEMIQEVRRVQKQERQKRTQAKSIPEESSEVFSIQARLQSNRNMPKLIRVLGVEADVPNRVFETTTSTGEPFEGPVLIVQQPISEEAGTSDTMETNLSGEVQDVQIRRILKKSAPSNIDTMSAIHPKTVEFNLMDGQGNDELTVDVIEFESLEDVDCEEHEDEEMPTFSSSLTRSNLSCLSKTQVIKLWKCRESKLRQKLADAIKEKEELAAKLQYLKAGKPP